jgi:hypothetical protein
MVLSSKAVVLFVMVLLVASPVLAQQARGATVPGLPNGVTRDGMSIALAKLERKGEDVRVWIAFRKVGSPPAGEDIVGFDVNIRDDRGNTYPLDPIMGTLLVPLPLGVDIKLLPVGFTWITSATIGMPAQAPIQSVIVNVRKTSPGRYYDWPFPISLDPRSAKWPTIDLDVVRKNDLTGEKFKLSRDITVWLGQPILEKSEKVLEEKTQRIRWRIPVFIQNEDYNPHAVPLSYIHYFLYFPSGEIMDLPVDPWSSQVISGLDLIPPTKTIQITHVTKFTDPFKDGPLVLMVEMAGGEYVGGHRFKMLGFLPLQPGRGAEAGGGLSGKQEAATAWTVHNAKMNYGSVIYANGLFVVGGSEGTILTSPDGEKWTKENSATFRYIGGIAYGNNLFVAIGSWGTLITSPDGRKWTEVQSLRLLSPTDVTFGNGRFVVVSGEGSIRTSLDAQKWKSPDYMPLGMTFRSLYGVTYSNGLFVAVGIRGTILTSPDGEKWSEQSSGTENSALLRYDFGI